MQETYQQRLTAKVAVLEIAVDCLGKLALRGPGYKLNAQELQEVHEALVDSLEILNDEKENY